MSAWHDEYILLIRSTLEWLQEDYMLSLGPKKPKEKKTMIPSQETKSYAPRPKPKPEKSTEKNPKPLTSRSPRKEPSLENTKTPLLGKTPSPKIALEFPASVKPDSFAELHQKMRKIAPGVHFYDFPLDDKQAKSVKNAWRRHQSLPQYPILYSKELEPWGGILKNIAQAIDLYFGTSKPVKIEDFEEGGSWQDFFSLQNLKLIIIPDMALFNTKHLITHYKEIPSSGLHYLDNYPALLLPDLSLYYKDPMLKKSLWNILCQMISKLPQ